MNKRIKKKHQWPGSKRVIASWFTYDILFHIIIKCKYAGIKPNIRNIKKHIRWFCHNSSQDERDKRVADAWQIIHRNQDV
jgi:hypothetical protein